MDTSSCIAGRMRQHDRPDWAPLRQLLGSDELCAHFMWMHDVELDDGTVINAYKHRWTRRYLHLCDGHRTFRYACALGSDKACYEEIDVYIAIAIAFDDWECCRPTSDDQAALEAALARAARGVGNV